MATGEDPFDLQRFVDAQRHVYAEALAELRAGRKQSHWIWFVFPQVRGLGMSEMNRRYAIAGLAEARAYLAHPVLGLRLAECVRAVGAHAGRSPEDILGMDSVKFRSSLTLFEAAADDGRAFAEALDQFFGGARDALTLQKLA